MLTMRDFILHGSYFCDKYIKKEKPIRMIYISVFKDSIDDKDMWNFACPYHLLVSLSLLKPRYKSIPINIKSWDSKTVNPFTYLK